MLSTLRASRYSQTVPVYEMGNLAGSPSYSNWLVFYWSWEIKMGGGGGVTPYNTGRLRPKEYLFKSSGV